MMSLMVILIGLVNVFIGGFGFMLAWNWFPAEIFDLPSLNFIGALGVSLTISFLTMDSSNAESDNEKALAQTIAKSIGYILLIVTGFIIQLFM